MTDFLENDNCCRYNIYKHNFVCTRRREIMRGDYSPDGVLYYAGVRKGEEVMPYVSVEKRMLSLLLRSTARKLLTL